MASKTPNSPQQFTEYLPKFDVASSFFFNPVSPSENKRISTQPQLGAHLEYVPNLKAEKVNKRPASNKPPFQPPSLPLKLHNENGENLMSALSQGPKI